MNDLPNGFTGFARRDSDFESAGDAIRRQRAESEQNAARQQGAAGKQQAAARQQGAAGRQQAAASGQEPSRRQSVPASAAEAPRGAFERRQIHTASRQASPATAARSAVSSSNAARPAGGEEIPYDPEQLDAMHVDEQRWAWVEVDLSAIRHNVAEIRRYLEPRTRLTAVVTADGYGHGAYEVSKAALGAGADRLAVSQVAEAVALRKAGITAPIMLLTQPPATSIPLLLGYHIVPALYEPDFAIAYGEEADRHGMTAPYHLAINTGMNRIGVRHDDVFEFLRQVDFHRALVLEGVFTHYATADYPETLDFQIQAKHFAECVDDIRAMGIDPGIVHSANSAAIFRYPAVHGDMVRAGLALYGIHPCAETRGQVDLRPAMSVHARIVDARLVPMSEGVSFGLSYRSPGSVKICTVPIGYADGLCRGLSGNVDFIMGGRYYRQVGNICMDQCMFEVDMRSYGTRERIDPQVGDEVVIVGSQGIAEVTIEDMAERMRTVPYEIAVGFGKSLPRIFV